MTTQLADLIRNIKTNIRNRTLSGLVVIIPLGVTYLVLKVMFNFLTGNINPIIKLIYGQLPEIVIAMISLIAVFVILYTIGFIAANVVGRRLILLGEKILMYIPLVKPVYHTSKQVLETLSSSNKDAFKSVVLVDFPRRGVKSIGFKTGTIRCEDGREYAKIIIPTTPNPTTGFLIFTAAEDVCETGLSLEDGMKVVISLGIVVPDNFASEFND